MFSTLDRPHLQGESAMPQARKRNSLRSCGGIPLGDPQTPELSDLVRGLLLTANAFQCHADLMDAACAEQWEQMWLPLWPLATDDLATGIYRRSRPKALSVRYIEANPRSLSNLLVVDCDEPDAVVRALWDRKQWLPNAVVENPSNGHAHAVWALQNPIPRTEYAHRKPLAYAAAVTEGLRRSVDGDAGYSGLITKNPEHPAWDTHWITNHLYSLGELDAGLSDVGLMPPPSWRRTRRKKPVGLGRNCAIFETARVWAYREARRIRLRHEHATRADTADLAAAIDADVSELNASYTEPLPDSEAARIARSITTWITTKSRLWVQSSTVTQATFTTIQSARGRKGGATRRRIRDKKLEKL